MANTTISFKDPKPKWATWMFRIQFFANKALMFWLSGTKLIKPEDLGEWILALGAIDLVVWGLAQGFGVKKDDYEDK